MIRIRKLQSAPAAPPNAYPDIVQPGPGTVPAAWPAEVSQVCRPPTLTSAASNPVRPRAKPAKPPE